jgi:UDP-2,3-diacylglucosamine hydrolase
MQPLGIIAGNGEFPLVFARAARRQGIDRLVAAAFEGETNPAIATLVDEVEWIRLGQLNKLIEVFTKRGIGRAVMAGGITPANLFKNLKLDLRMIAVAARLKERNAETIFGAIATELGKDGVALIDPRTCLGDAVPAAGPLTRRKPDSRQAADVAFGTRIAKAVSALDIGQTVVVKEGTVLAVEGFEGTDECIRRGGALAGDQGGAVVVKVSKPNQDFRFDIPCVGVRTVESCAAGRIAVLAVEADRSLLLDRAAVLAAADQQGVTIVAVDTAAA